MFINRGFLLVAAGWISLVVCKALHSLQTLPGKFNALNGGTRSMNRSVFKTTYGSLPDLLLQRLLKADCPNQTLVDGTRRPNPGGPN